VKAAVLILAVVLGTRQLLLRLLHTAIYPYISPETKLFRTVKQGFIY
jgi:hypothetical protein